MSSGTAPTFVRRFADLLDFQSAEGNLESGDRGGPYSLSALFKPSIARVYALWKSTGNGLGLGYGRHFDACQSYDCNYRRALRLYRS